MSTPQASGTARLFSIIQQIQLSRRGGLLIVRRGEGAIAEEGSVLFLHGQIIEARAGRRLGSEALNYLTTWQHCRYVFVPKNGPGLQNPANPAELEGSQQHGQPAHTNTATTPRPDLLSQQAQASNPARIEEKHTDQNMPSIILRNPEQAIPRLTQLLPITLRGLEQQGFSRTHRHLLLLINGKRSITELQHLVRRSMPEMYQLLYELKRARLIIIEPKQV
ncbi:DUF4388 domain-containing protein [Ktedonosporobacter rubrisoli]|nr:DUF4388 domain-containing protein [Ktedonosporobacter rubrisoli]